MITKKGELSSERKRINDRLGEIRRSLSDEEKKYVMKAGFVATTVAKAVSDTTISSAYFDTVLFDEASMAYIPQIVYAANLAKAHFVCFGDFCQLPPIVQSNKNVFLNADIFTYCGIKPAVDKRWGHNWLCLLNTQHRMHPSISTVNNSGMYGGLLEDDEKIIKDKDRNKIISYEPFMNEAIGLIDVSNLPVYCRRTKDYSHYNLLTALIDYSTAISVIFIIFICPIDLLMLLTGKFISDKEVFVVMIRIQEALKNLKDRIRNSLKERAALIFALLAMSFFINYDEGFYSMISLIVVIELICCGVLGIVWSIICIIFFVSGK